MAINYTNEYGSRLPYAPMNLHNFTNVPDGKAAVINYIKELQAQGRYDEAAALIQSNNLASCMLTSEVINQMDEETRNLEIMCMSEKQSIFFTAEPPGFAIEGDVWIET